MAFFKRGAFGFNGLIGMWTPLIIFCVWMVIMSVYMLRAIDREQHRLQNLDCACSTCVSRERSASPEVGDPVHEGRAIAASA